MVEPNHLLKGLYHSQIKSYGLMPPGCPVSSMNLITSVQIEAFTLEDHVLCSAGRISCIEASQQTNLTIFLILNLPKDRRSDAIYLLRESTK